MKFILIALIMFVSGLQIIRGQVTNIDTLKTLLAQTGQDTNRVLLLVELAATYQFFNSDTALSLTDEALELSRKLNFKKGEVLAISRQGEVRHLRGELPQALEAELTAIQSSRIYNFPHSEGESSTFIAIIYLDLGEYRKALDYLFQAKKVYDNIANQLPIGVAREFPAFVLSNIGIAYEKLNMPDSALYFEKLALNSPIQLSYQLRSDILVRIGIAESRKENYKEASTNFRHVLTITGISNDLLERGEAQYQMAKLFSQQNNTDSAIHYARLAFVTAQQSKEKTVLLDAGGLLATLYKTRGDMDSAFHYLQTAMNVKDSLFGLDKFHKLQLLTLSEQQRMQQLKEEQARSKARMQQTILLLSIAVFLLIAFVLWRSNSRQKKANNILNEKNIQIEAQSENLKKTLHELKSTQAQLIQSEKMASLGELTAGIAHEIQNPLNFVNNFSEVNNELIEEINDENDINEIKAIANDIKQNNEKIAFHGKRADAIVKGMLQHSRTSTGQKEPTDINKLADEYLRLSYHGMRAKDKLFNATLQADFDASIGKINVVPQDIGRVLLNLFNNAFYAVMQKNASTSSAGQPYKATVSVRTKKVDGKFEIHVKDNGDGISQKVVDKIFQPFFTTKPTGQGTGLGLSLSYDIIKAHSGEIKVETKEGEGAEFIIQLPC